MRHRVKKTKFRYGKDANRALLKKLAINFISRGKLTTTKAKAKAVVSFLDKLLNRVKKSTATNKSFLDSKLGNRKISRLLIKEIIPSIKEKTSGHFQLTFLGQRLSDGSEMVRINWSTPVVLPDKKAPSEKEEK